MEKFLVTSIKNAVERYHHDSEMRYLKRIMEHTRKMKTLGYAERVIRMSDILNINDFESNPLEVENFEDDIKKQNVTTSTLKPLDTPEFLEKDDAKTTLNDIRNTASTRVHEVIDNLLHEDDVDELEEIPKGDLPKPFLLTHHNDFAKAKWILEKNLLLAKQQSELIERLVVEKFKPILEEHQKKRRKRKNLVCTCSDEAQKVGGDGENRVHAAEETSVKEEESLPAFDAISFLKQALGDEYASFNTTRSTIHSQEADSVGTSNISCLISRASETELQSRDFESFNEETANTQSLNSTQEDSETALISKTLIECQLIVQASKAVALCEAKKQFSSSMERVEAERALLLACCRKKALFEEMRKEDYELAEEDVENRGRVTISNLTFSTKSGCLPKDNEWFVCVLQCNEKVFATKPSRMYDEGLLFKDSFTFDDLPKNFEINVGIFSLTIENNLSRKNVCWPSPKKLLSKLRKRRNEIPSHVTIRTPSFTQQGQTAIRISDVNKTNLHMFRMPPSSTLSASMSLTTKSSVDIRTNYEGFLNIGTTTSSPIIWNYYWCSLEGSELRFWYDRADAAWKSPLKRIDLRRSALSLVTLAPRSICARSKTLYLEIFVGELQPIELYFLNVGCVEDLKRWSEKLNLVLESIKLWENPIGDV